VRPSSSTQEMKSQAIGVKVVLDTLVEDALTT
jgi:hypothetical protein